MYMHDKGLTLAEVLATIDGAKDDNPSVEEILLETGLEVEDYDESLE